MTIVMEQHGSVIGNNALLLKCVGMKCVADTLPNPFYQLTIHGKWVAVGVLGVYCGLIALWLPFWLLSFVLTEAGVYVAAIIAIFMIGRSIIRLIAFPGASPKVVKDMELEFAKYSIRMFHASLSAICDLSQILVQAGGGGTSDFENQNGTPNNQNNIAAEQQQGPQQPIVLDSRKALEMPQMWKRIHGFQNRVLGVYLEVLLYLYEETNSSPTNAAAPDLTRYGNNRLSGDIGNYTTLTSKAFMDGKELLDRLKRLMELLDTFQQQAGKLLERPRGGPTTASATVTPEALETARVLFHTATELRDFTVSLKPSSSSSFGNSAENNGTNGDAGRFTQQDIDTNIDDNNAQSTMEAIKMGLSSVMPMLDPAPHTCIFGFDVQRGCMLSRYRGARQLWVPRTSGGGMIDVLHFPAKNYGASLPRNPQAVLYCNPNAGLIEVAAGMSLSGGNVPAAENDNYQSNNDNDSWVDFYTDNGLDVYVFNYAGYGRSFGTTPFVKGRTNLGDPRSGFLARIGRIVRGTFFTFQPTPDTLRADGVAVAQHLISDVGVEQLIIHGESIGGMSASGTARYLTQPSQYNFYRNKIALLICDRTFCNLEAVAQRLVGGWTGYAIRALAPMWNTDVAGDFIAAKCSKVVASDAADVIINDAASLKSGIALWKEIHRGVATTKGLGWMVQTPLQYRMADFDNVCVNDSRYVTPNGLFRAQPPTWPRDKHVSVEEAFHFAACCKRIGKYARAAAAATMRSHENDEEAGGHANQSPRSKPLVLQAWIILGCCDGLTGATLGVATKRGFDAVVAWLCSSLTFGGQTVAAIAEARMNLQQQQEHAEGGVVVEPSDFDERPADYQQREAQTSILFPKPIPEVIQELTSMLDSGDEVIIKLQHEFQYVLGMLQYMQQRLAAPATIEVAQSSRKLIVDDSGVGSFLNLHCGHNNPFSRDERQNLMFLLALATKPRDTIS